MGILARNGLIMSLTQQKIGNSSGIFWSAIFAKLFAKTTEQVNLENLPVLTAQKGSFPLKISPVNVTKFAGSCGFGHIY